MTEKIKKGDFIEIEYTGKLKELDAVFDTTNADVAKKEEIFDPKVTYGPIELCVGEGQLLKGLDDAVVGLEPGTEHTIDLEPEQAFGKKDGKLLKLVPTSVFKKQGINPVPSLQVNIDGSVGTIRSVSGGRTVVDFNHPFASKIVTYDIKINRFITDDDEKVATLLSLALNQKKDSLNVKIDGDKVAVDVMQQFPEEFLNMLKERILKVLPKFKTVVFNAPGAKVPKPAEKKVAEKATEKKEHVDESIKN